MSTWLESEEKKKKDNLQKEECAYKKNEYLDENLKKFYDLCKRVNGVRLSSLDISTRAVIGKEFLVYYEDRCLHDYIRITSKNEIQFNYVESEGFLLDIYMNEIIDDFVYECGHKYTKHQRLLFRKRVTIEDIINWSEEKMLNFIQWLIHESDSSQVNFNKASNRYDYVQFLSSPTENLPGKENITVVFDIESELAKLNKELVIEKNILSDIKKWQFGRSESEKNEQLDKQNKIIYLIMGRIFNIGIQTTLL